MQKLILKTLGIIPARYDSLRFPGKPLAIIAGKTMIQRVYEQAIQAKLLDKVIIATDNIQIFEHVNSFGGNVLMTNAAHENGTSRCAEVVENYEHEQFEYVINIQGDEPFIQPAQIDELVTFISNGEADIVTQVKIETDIALLNNPSIVKAILTEDFFCTDFLRILPNPKSIIQNFHKHIGLYGFTSSALKRIVKLAVSKNEQERKLEQMRWLDNGFSIKAGATNYESISIDTEEDLQKAIELFC